jgi:(E)-4-hydroxy-3-methylbut-2-enyl-diphosphate synthase
MTNTETANVEATVSQIARLERAGCELVRVAVPHLAAAKALPAIKERIGIPLVADVHFDPRLALAAIEAGVDKLRLNPGNITDEKEIARVARAAKTRGIPIRVGANSGSLAPQFRDAQGRAAAGGLVESALREVCLLEDLGFTEIVLSVKGTDVPMTVAAYRAVASRVDYPLHLGITEAGTAWDSASPLPPIRSRRCARPTRSCARSTFARGGSPTTSARPAAGLESTSSRSLGQCARSSRTLSNR